MDRGIKDVTQDNFDAEVVQHPGPVIVLFYAIWCGPSQRVLRDLDSIALGNPEAKFLLLDIDQSSGLCGRQDIRQTPTLVGYKGKEILDRLVGYRPTRTTEKWVRDVISRYD